jgi:hypothetical protein
MLVPTVSVPEFDRIWQTSASVAEFARKVGRSKNACRVRAFRYRQYGGFPPVEVELIDWDEFRQFADELVTEEGRAASPAEPGEMDREIGFETTNPID